VVSTSESDFDGDLVTSYKAGKAGKADKAASGNSSFFLLSQDRFPI
jgi:hypothetical protein